MSFTSVNPRGNAKIPRQLPKRHKTVDAAAGSVVNAAPSAVNDAASAAVRTTTTITAADTAAAETTRNEGDTATKAPANATNDDERTVARIQNAAGLRTTTGERRIAVSREGNPPTVAIAEADTTRRGVGPWARIVAPGRATE